MRRYTNRALLVSFALHIGLMLAIAPFLVNHFNVEKESISAELLEPEVEERVRRRVLPLRTPLVPQVNVTEASTSLPSSPTYALEVSVPKAPVHADVVPDIVTHADIPQTDAPSLVSNASFGDNKIVGGPVVGQLVIEGSGSTGSPIFRTPAGFGIFETNVMPGRGFIGEVFVPGGAIFRMPDFEGLTPVYTFVTPNLNVPTRSYTRGFSIPEMQPVIENFAIRFRAKLKIDTPGIYIFELLSDDGSQLYIDETLVVDNDGVHSTTGKQDSIKLATGVHNVEIRYFQGPRHQIALQWFYQPPNADRQIVPPGVIYHPDKPEIPDASQKLQQQIEEIE